MRQWLKQIRAGEWRRSNIGLASTMLALLLFSPLGFNCHQSTDQSTAFRPDDSDQTVRTMASVQDAVGPLAADGAPADEPKVRIGPNLMTSASQAKALGLAGKLASEDDTLVPADAKLMALYDNDCRGKPSDLRFEAEALPLAETTSMSALTAQAEADPCLLRIDENPTRQWLLGEGHDPTDRYELLSTVNDPRVSEARHILFSKALSAWDWFFSDAGIKTDVILAVVDSGVWHTHPDLTDNMWRSQAGTAGYDFVNGDSDPLDDNGHGTHVAGIVGARANNGIGVTGVIGQRVRIMAVKVTNASGRGEIDDIVNGIRYAADQGAHVMNLSIGGRFSDTAVRDALTYAVSRGVVIVIACGNDNRIISPTDFFTPAGYARDLPGAIAVGSVDAVSGARSSFSTFGPSYVWIAAPGSLGTTNGVLSTYRNDQYQQLQGTSMASPVVAGAAALLVGAFRGRGLAYAPSDVVTLLTESAQPVQSLNTFFRDGATLDIERAAKLFFSRYVMASNGGAEVNP